MLTLEILLLESLGLRQQVLLLQHPLAFLPFFMLTLDLYLLRLLELLLLKAMLALLLFELLELEIDQVLLLLLKLLLLQLDQLHLGIQVTFSQLLAIH